MSENQNINVEPSNDEPNIGEEITDAKSEEKSFIEKAKESFFANGGTVKKANPGNSGRKRNRSNRASSNSKKAGKGNSVSSGRRKPVLSMWRMLNIKVGTKLVWLEKGGAICVKTSAVVLDDFSMKLEVTYGKKKKVVDGLMRGEIFARNMKNLPCPKKPQGWDKWGVEQKGKVLSIHSIYDSLTAEQLLKRRGF
mgnify:CR=1 FL=1|tara:strand:- start:457 stop:1041 length:585 start_codon:yes stop_codon:yes gene_type:complete